MFAKLVGEGYENPNAEEVLDVNYSKVGEWLVSFHIQLKLNKASEVDANSHQAYCNQ